MASVDLTEALTLAALRAVLITWVAPGTEVIRAEYNRVPEPQGADFITMTSKGYTRLASDTETLDSDAGILRVEQSMQYDVTVDIHGPNSADNATIISTLFRSGAVVAAFAAVTTLAIAPLYADDPAQAPFLNAEQQIEMSWSVDVALQVKPVVSVPQQSALAVTPVFINVDASYPPGAPE